MSIALDFGTHRLKCLRRRFEHLVGRNCRTALSVVPNTEASRRILENVNVTYAVCDDNLVVLGDSAIDVSRLIQIPSVSPLPDGHVPKNDPPARQVVLSLLNAVLPPPETEGELCCMTVPGGNKELRRLDGQIRNSGKPSESESADAESDKPKSRSRSRMKFSASDDSDDLEFLSHLVRLRGYEPMVINAGMAGILANNSDTYFSGLGIDFGASTSDASLAVMSEEISHCNIRKGGNWIDESLALEFNEFAWDSRGNKYLDTDSIGRWKEELETSITEPTDPRQARMAELYEQLITDVLEQVATEVSRVPRMNEVQQPATLVACGGAARIKGFDRMLGQVVAAMDFPIRIGDVRVAAESDYDIARGLLINGELENKLARTAKRAA